MCLYDIKMNFLDFVRGYHSFRTISLHGFSSDSGTSSHHSGCGCNNTSSSKMCSSSSSSNLFSVTMVICVILCSVFPSVTGTPVETEAQAVVRFHINLFQINLRKKNSKGKKKAHNFTCFNT